MTSENLTEIIYRFDTAIKNDKSTPMKFRNQDLHDLLIETLS